MIAVQLFHYGLGQIVGEQGTLCLKGLRGDLPLIGRVLSTRLQPSSVHRFMSRSPSFCRSVSDPMFKVHQFVVAAVVVADDPMRRSVVSLLHLKIVLSG